LAAEQAALSGVRWAELEGHVAALKERIAILARLAFDRSTLTQCYNRQRSRSKAVRAVAAQCKRC
jgi:hypothetical protein